MIPHFCDGKHLFSLDSVHMNAYDSAQDTMYFSCKREIEVHVNSAEITIVRCSATRTIDRGVFWNGPVKIKEQYVDPEWERNYSAHIYNENMRAFEREWARPLLYIPN